MGLEKQSSNKVFGGDLTKYSFQSSSLGDLTANLNLFLPPSASASSKVPILYFLAGLTCTEDNAAQKGAMFEAASQEGIAICFPDTSPRGAKIEGEDESWDFGTGAGFYVNATKDPWSKHYRMYDHVVKEIPSQLQAAGLPIDFSRSSVFGHSMGGHGALTLYLKGEAGFKSCSAFSPICHPTACPWGEKAFQGYLAGGLEEGKQHDATELLRTTKGKRLNILIDSGLGDNFYKQKQLLPEDFESAARENGHGEDEVKVRLQDGYDHSYFFISTFAPEHIRWHAKFLHNRSPSPSGKAKYAAHFSNGDPTILAQSYTPTHPDLFRVHFSPGDYKSSLVAQRAFKKDEVLAYMTDAEESSVKRYSTVQVGEDKHIELNSDLLYINHSCSPSVRFEVSGPKDTWRTVAERDISSGESLSFFYPSTEWNMAQPFACTCDSQGCLKTISGAKNIPADSLLGAYYVNQHIRRLKEEQQAAK